MNDRQAKRALWVGAVLCFVAMLMPAGSAAQRGSGAGTSASASRSYHFTYSGKPPLLNSVKKTLKGDKKKDGGCVWHPADMTLAPQDLALEQRQISADYAACTTVVEIGNPTSIESTSGEALANESAPTAGGAGYAGVTGGSSSKARRLAAASAYNTSQAYYKVTWYDIVGVDVNHVRSILNWTWGNGGCIVGSVASSATYLFPSTGWGRTSWNWWKTTSCQDHRTHTDADFINRIFCPAVTVQTHYRDVRIRGGYTGTYGAALDSTSTDASGPCPPLHWGGQVVKEY